jgi:hypothetical protein
MTYPDYPLGSASYQKKLFTKYHDIMNKQNTAYNSKQDKWDELMKFKTADLQQKFISNQVTEKSLPVEPLPHPDTDAARSLKSKMGQTWLHNVNAMMWMDQHGFTIEKTENEKPYRLTHKGSTLGDFYRLHTAKLVSTIAINDIILHKSMPSQDEQETITDQNIKPQP